VSSKAYHYQKGNPTMNQQELSNQELAVLIAQRMDQMIIFTGMDGNHCITPEIESVTMNGNCIQITTFDIQKENQQ